VEHPVDVINTLLFNSDDSFIIEQINFLNRKRRMLPWTKLYHLQ
jgi:hypothetical protein